MILNRPAPHIALRRFCHALLVFALALIAGPGIDSATAQDAGVTPSLPRVTVDKSLEPPAAPRNTGDGDVTLSQAQAAPPQPDTGALPRNGSPLQAGQRDDTKRHVLRLTPDKPMIIRLPRPMNNVVLPNNVHMNVVPDTRRTLILIPQQPGATFFRALDADGEVIMERHVIIAAPNEGYVRVRRSCINGGEDCRPYSMFYCPQGCHEMYVPAESGGAAVPGETAGGGTAGDDGDDGDDEDTE